MASHLMLAPLAHHKSQVELTEAQSLALVKIFLNASLACICHTRELLDWQSTCFRKRYINQISLEDENSYDNFCHFDPAAPGHSQEIRILVRSNDQAANQLLDLIEHGVFEAVEAGYLDVLQVFVTTDSGDHKTIRETYTYSFNYYGKSVSSIELKEQQQHLSLPDAQRSFKSAIRCLLRSIKDLPRLPGKRSLGMSTAYKSDCPNGYEPVGFTDAANHKIVGEDWAKLWDGSGPVIGKLDSSHHTVDLTARNSTFGYQTASQIQDTVISNQLQNLQKTSSGRHDGLVSTLPGPPISPIRSALPTTGSSRQTPRSESSSPKRDGNGSTSMSKTRPPRTRKSVRSKSVKTPIDNEGLVEHIKNPLQGLAVLARSRRRRDIVLEKMAEAVVQAYCLDFEAPNGTTFFDRDDLDQGILTRLEQSDVVHCECGYQTGCEHMVFCHLCNSWQHSECYGLTLITRQGSMPNQHLCYSCLLLPRASELLKDMAGLVHMRLALMHISGLKGSAIDLVGGLSVQVFGTAEVDDEFKQARLFERLVQEGIISPPQNGFASILPVTAEQLRRMQTEYLDPLAAISHLYRTVRDGDSDEARLAELGESLSNYSRHQDYTIGQGAEDVVVIDSFGHPVVRWGYYTDDSLKRKAVMETQEEPSPRRRRISVSKAFISLDRSTPTSPSLEDNGTARVTHEAVTPIHDTRSPASISTVTDL
ncbi:uncharacterized protein HMPREF1541_02848 [Cyphellophora europaea CBS 101466]|uniref:HORMA domain-containing protein n=1 Tax=Cyphellophora europaea (strain CBS 101466) TaxID=1220924 RepID=W2S6W9_CYPE1|nr:uncharacterized protein HMPREF1541_02848 [Cyphellophora europaea CBS 101466]ETN43689.1 hypothetical protein HMPREF1541_02848 [Cyphellophora europaea CBS 101466]